MWMLSWANGNKDYPYCIIKNLAQSYRARFFVYMEFLHIFVHRRNEFLILKVMNFEQLNFTMFCVANVADALKMSAGKVYRLLRESGILMDYIVPSYDVLHTFGKDYLVEDIVSYMREKGVF